MELSLIEPCHRTLSVPFPMLSSSSREKRHGIWSGAVGTMRQRVSKVTESAYILVSEWSHSLAGMSKLNQFIRGEACITLLPASILLEPSMKSRRSHWFAACAQFRSQSASARSFIWYCECEFIHCSALHCFIFCYSGSGSISGSVHCWKITSHRN